jgi:hypothetical protein
LIVAEQIAAENKTAADSLPRRFAFGGTVLDAAPLTSARSYSNRGAAERKSGAATMGVSRSK